MKAMINNQLLTVEVKDVNYNDHAVEVEILEGTFKGKYIIVEKKDLVRPSLAKIITVAKNEIKENNITIEDLENNSICELLQDTCKEIESSYNELVTISNKEWSIMDSIYCEYDTIEDAKRGILYSVIENEVCGIHKTIKQVKNEIIKNIIE